MREIPQIDIQDPPVTELKKKRSCLARSCFSGCGCIVFFFIGMLLLLNLLTGSGSKEVKTIPDVFPQDIMLYEQHRTDAIRISRQPLRGGVASLAGIVPKAFLATTYLALGESAPNSIRHTYETIPKEGTPWHYVKQLMQTPIANESQQITIRWYALPAEPRFIQEFYITALETNGYTITITEHSPTKRHILFEKDGTTGQLFIQDTQVQEKGTDLVELTVYVSSVAS